MSARLDHKHIEQRIILLKNLKDHKKFKDMKGIIEDEITLLSAILPELQRLAAVEELIGETFNN